MGLYRSLQVSQSDYSKLDMDSPLSQVIPASRPRFYRPELDAMRFFAFICVFIHHAFTRSAPHMITSRFQVENALPMSLKHAVSLFFLLSGYLITVLLKIEQQFSGTVHVAAFFKGRVARIWPLYYTFISLVVLIGLRANRIEPSRGALAANFVFLGNWFLIAGGASSIGALGILWSVI
jgi:peptidoglycan/LPS O-acetylase OafA/YrhL